MRNSFVIIVGLLDCAVAATHAATFNVSNYGAVGDGHALDSTAIQKTIDTCAGAGGGTVLLTAGTYVVKPLFLHGNNLTFQLDSGATLLGATDFTDYKVDGEIVGLINADRMTNVVLSGDGIIDGAGAPWWPAVKESKRTGKPEPRRRPKMVNFRHCRNLTVENVTLRNSPSFHLVPTDCENVLIDHVTIQAPGDSPNTDAIDPGACRNVRIINCLLDVGDDNVALKAGHPVVGRAFCCEDIVVSNCTCLHGHGVSIGSETSGGVNNFTVVHCSFDGTVSGVRIKTTREKGGPVQNIFYRDLTMKNVKRPIDISCYYPKIPTNDSPQPISSRTPTYRDIHIENLSGDCPDSAGLIVGLPESPVRGVTMTNVHLKTRTGLLVKNTEKMDLKDVHFDVREGAPIVTEIKGQ
jgi:polygalacturonase